jgi:hypothetical protein
VKNFAYLRLDKTSFRIARPLAIDDAIGEVLYALFRDEEDTQGYQRRLVS